MKKLAHRLVAHLRADWDPVVYGFTALGLAGLLYANYALDAFAWIEQDARPVWRLGVFAVYYGLPYAAVLGLQALRGRVELGVPGLTRALAIALFIVALANWFPYHHDLAALFPRPVRGYVVSVAWNLKSTLCWFLPLLLYWYLFDRSTDPTCYGLTLRGFDARPYLVGLAVVLPLSFWASFQPAFLEQYPTYKPGTAEVFLGVSPWLTTGLYELVYGFDFMFVELYFRGFLVIGMARWLGRSAVLPMVAMYAVLHFGKPLPETLGSIVGGYILGVFAHDSRSIAGGVMLHLGLAWSMEATAFLQHALRS